MAASNLARLFAILRPQDVVVISIRELRRLRVSAYYEFYRIFKDLKMEEVRSHPLMEPFCQDFFDSVIPEEYRDRVFFSKLEDYHSVLGNKLNREITEGLKGAQVRNRRKKKSTKVLVKTGSYHVFPKWFFWIDNFINPVLWQVS